MSKSGTSSHMGLEPQSCSHTTLAFRYLSPIDFSIIRCLDAFDDLSFSADSNVNLLPALNFWDQGSPGLFIMHTVQWGGRQVVELISAKINSMLVGSKAPTKCQCPVLWVPWRQREYISRLKKYHCSWEDMQGPSAAEKRDGLATSWLYQEFYFLAITSPPILSISGFSC